MRVHILLYDSGTDSEGIHSLEIHGKTVVLMFEDRDDASRYCGLLEAQDFPVPSIEELDSEEVEHFCNQAGYEARLVEEGFVPKTQEERLMLTPPESNRDVTNWKDEIKSKDISSNQDKEHDSNEIELMRKKLEGLI